MAEVLWILMWEPESPWGVLGATRWTCVPFLPLSLIQSFPWCSDCVAECCDVLVKCWFCYGFFCFSPVPLSLGNEIVALMQQEAVGRREACLGEEFSLPFPAEVQSQGRTCTGSVTRAPAPCPILLPQSLDAQWGMAFLECPARVLKTNPEHWL